MSFPSFRFLLCLSSSFFFPFSCRDIKMGVGLKAENGKNMEGKDKGQGSRVSTGSLAYEILRGICKGYPGFFFSSISICSVFIYLPLVFHYLALLLPYFFLFSPKKSKKNKNKSLCFHVSSASTYASTKTWSAVVTFALRTFSPELSIEKTNGGNDETDRLRKILGGPRG
ncbi:hypothetical protein GE21DRAFT_1089332 [Neurospora crassa]|nr:hypothetical protein GE21DRAFT_1089332 [Neurospora crassa]